MILLIGRLFLGLLILLLLLVGFVLLNSGHPLIESDLEITVAERRWANDWIRAHRPSRLREGHQAVLTLTERQANVVASELLHRIGPARSRIRLGDGQADILASVGMPWSSDLSFLNLRLRILSSDGGILIDNAEIAGIPLPGPLIQGLAERTLQGLMRSQLLQYVDLTAERAVIVYEWHRDAVDAVGTAMLPEAQQEPLRHYQQVVNRLADAHSGPRWIGLSDLLSALLKSAHHRSATRDPLEENRAAIAVGAAYVNGHMVSGLPGRTHKVAKPRFYTVRLRGRPDLAQHFMASAAMAAQAGSLLSDAVGLLKELKDVNGGSGFSFADMAANRTGVRFAELATASEADAKRVQHYGVAGLKEDQFMPVIEGLAEGLSKRRFESTFGGSTSRAYADAVAMIDRRIDARPLFRNAVMQ